MSVDEAPLELRVHGVGGPQARKILGMLDEEDILTLLPFDAPGVGDFANGESRVPVDGQSRFARRVQDDRTEAYEWGGLTTGSLVKALWIVYFPFTVINAAGWAHGAVTDEGSGRRLAASYRAGVRVLAGLATSLYVLWIGYIALDLIAVRWRDHVIGQHEVSGVLLDAVDTWMPIIAPLAFVVVVGLLVGVVTTLGQFETVGNVDDEKWQPIPAISDGGFFAHANRYGFLRNIHIAIAAATALIVVVLYIVDWDRLGLILVLMAAMQTLVLIALCGVDGYARYRPPSPICPDDGPEVPSGYDTPRWIPMGAVIATIGTTLVHLAFCGAATLLRAALANLPEPDPSDVITVRAELGSGDVLGGIIVCLLALTAIAVASLWFRDDTDGTRSIVVKLTRRTQQLGLIFLIAVAIPVVIYAVLNAGDLGWASPGEWWHSLERWYDGYRFDSASLLQQVGALVLVALPAYVYFVLRGPYDSGLARAIGNAWDVLTFWPRRYHPLAAPPSAERAVPELRARIEHTLESNCDLVVVAHSQGSVLAVAAIASLPDRATATSRIHLVTFGSPLGTLYAPTWPAYIPPLLGAVATRVDPKPSWVNFWRNTDPVGAGVPFARNEELPDPRRPSVEELDAAADLPPLERPQRADSISRHSHYLATPAVRNAIARMRSTGTPPTAPRN